MQQVERRAIRIPGLVGGQVAIVGQRGQRPGIVQGVFQVGRNSEDLAVIAQLVAHLVGVDVHRRRAVGVHNAVHREEAGGELRAGGLVFLIVHEHIGGQGRDGLPMDRAAHGSRVLAHQVGRIGRVRNIAVHPLHLASDAHGQRIAEGKVVMAFAAHKAVVAAFQRELAFIAGGGGAVLDIVDAADQGALSKQGCLRSFHHFHALNVVDRNAGGIAGRADGNAVLEDGHARRAAIGHNPAQRICRRVEALRLNLQAGNEVGEVFNVVPAQLVDQVLVGHRDVDRNIDQRLLGLLGRHGHDFQAARVFGVGCFGKGGKLARDAERGNGSGGKDAKFHVRPCLHGAGGAPVAGSLTSASWPFKSRFCETNALKILKRYGFLAVAQAPRIPPVCAGKLACCGRWKRGCPLTYWMNIQ